MQPLHTMFRCVRRAMAVPCGGLCLLLVLCPCVAVGDDRDGAHEGTPVAPYYVAPSEAAVIRADLSQIIATLDAITAQYGLGELSERSAAAHVALANVPDEHLGVYVDAMPKIQHLREVLDEVEFSTRRRELQSSERSGESQPGAASGLPNAVYNSGKCAPPREDTATIRGYLIALDVARAVWTALDRVCQLNFTTVLPPPPLNSNAMVACIPADIVLIAAETLVEIPFFCTDDIDGVEVLGSYHRFAHIHTDLNDFRSGSYTEASSSSSLLTNKNLIISAREAVLAAWATFLAEVLGAIHDMDKKLQSQLITEFEMQNAGYERWRNLSTTFWAQSDLGVVNDVARMGSFQLPGTFGGPLPSQFDGSAADLDKIKTIVGDVIDAMKTTGQEVFEAPGLKVKGDHEFALGNYKQAYDHYVAAYREATRIE